MKVSKKRFVIAKKDIVSSSKVLIEKDDVGIVKSVKNNMTTVFFVRNWNRLQVDESCLEYFDVIKTGDGFSKKICNVCHKLLDTTEFAKNQNGKNNRSVRRPSCSECRKSLEGINMSSSTKREWQKKKPNNEPFECPICAKRTIAGVTSKVVLDHNHITGEARGWVCDSCNTGIGRFKDDISLIKRAIRFIKK